jgi:hypothetical protein
MFVPSNPETSEITVSRFKKALSNELTETLCYFICAGMMNPPGFFICNGCAKLGELNYPSVLYK